MNLDECVLLLISREGSKGWKALLNSLLESYKIKLNMQMVLHFSFAWFRKRCKGVV